MRKSVSLAENRVLQALYCIYGIAALVLAAYGAMALCSYVVSAGIATIFVYSWAWCVSCELADEDYQSDIAKSAALLLWLVLMLVPGLVLVLGLELGLWLWLGLVLGLWLGLDKTKSFLFIGAYLHYRKRGRGERK